MAKTASRFEFRGFKTHWPEGKIEFFYCVIFDNHTSLDFVEKMYIAPEDQSLNVANNQIIQQALHNLHLILGISYYKLYCPKEIKIDGFSLTKEQAEFWNTVYTKGLGEFFYKNKIDYQGLVNFPYANETNSTPGVELYSRQSQRQERVGRALVGIGGGKDSILAAEMVKKTGVEFETWHFSYSLSAQIAKTLSLHPLVVKRELDPMLFELVKAGKVYNGHIPISAIYAFIGLLLGVLFDYRYLVFGNERSSNYGNIEYLGSEVNHQWSKSIEFENLFRTYVKKYITGGVEYFSLLRPLYEIEIVRRFVEYPDHFSLFSSCNRNFSINDPLKNKLWCGECAKCAFVFCLLAAFLPKEKIVKIFGENLFEKKNLLDIYRELLGVKDIKPFECVGTPEEVTIAFYKARGKGEYNNDIAMEMFEKEVLPTIANIDELETRVFSYGNDNNIPERFKSTLKK